MSFYHTGEVPSHYICQDCGVHGFKLWREYNTFLDHQTFLCARCAGKSQKKDVSAMDDDGKTPWYFEDQFMGTTDQIGWLVPAVPTEENDTYWGYSSVPQDGVDWWKKLPSLTNGLRKKKNYGSTDTR